MQIETGFPLSRLTTIGTGGTASALARPATLAELEEAIAWASERGLPVVTVGLGSNVLPADDGVDALVLRLEGDLAAVSIDGTLLSAGGGATNAVCLHRARTAGLGGLEFACAIPGTAGGGVRMNAGAYGSDWAAILERALVVSASGSGWLTADELGLSYRQLGPASGRCRRPRRVPAHTAADRRDQGRGRPSRHAPQGHAADQQADVRLGLQEPAG